MPEAQAIGKALQTSAPAGVAAQPRARLRRARLPRAAHPAHGAAPRARGPHPARRRTRGREGGRGPLHRAASTTVNRSAGELVALSRRGHPGRGSGADPARPGHPARPALGRPAGRGAPPALGVRRGRPEMAFTPGPVEHVLDLVLSDIVLAGKGPVKITFLGRGRPPAHPDAGRVSSRTAPAAPRPPARRRHRRGPRGGRGAGRPGHRRRSDRGPGDPAPAPLSGRSLVGPASDDVVQPGITPSSRLLMARRPRRCRARAARRSTAG